MSFKKMYKRKIQIIINNNNKPVPVWYSTVHNSPGFKKKKKKSKKVLHESTMHQQCIDYIKN